MSEKISLDSSDLNSENSIYTKIKPYTQQSNKGVSKIS